MSSFITLFKTFFSLNLLDFMISIPYAFAFASLAFCQIWKKKNIFWHKNIKNLSLFQIFLHFYCFLDDRLWKLIYFNIQYFFLYLLICTVIHQLSTSSFLFSQIYLHVSQCLCSLLFIQLAYGDSHIHKNQHKNIFAYIFPHWYHFFKIIW